jgi:hypothetical protein
VDGEEGIRYGELIAHVHNSRSLPWFLLPKTHRSVTDRMIREEMSGEAFGDGKSWDELHRIASFVMRDGHLVERKGRVANAAANNESPLGWSNATAYPPGTPQRRSGTWLARATTNPKPWSKHSQGK